MSENPWPANRRAGQEVARSRIAWMAQDQSLKPWERDAYGLALEEMARRQSGGRTTMCVNLNGALHVGSRYGT